MPKHDIFLLFQEKYRFNIGKPMVFCPGCREVQQCKQKELWRCITMLYAPVKKNVLLSSYYKCQTCKRRFATSVDWANLSPSNALEHALLCAMVRVRGANGRFRRAEATIVRDAYIRMTQHEQNTKNTSLDGKGIIPSEDDIKLCSRHMKNITQEAGIEEDFMPYLVEKLTDNDKKLVVRGMACVTLNKKQMEPKEAIEIEVVGNILGLDPATVHEVTTNWNAKG